MNSIIIAMMHKHTHKTTHTKPQRTSHLIELRQVRSNISQVIHQTGKLHSKQYSVFVHAFLFWFLVAVSRHIIQGRKKTNSNCLSRI